MSDFHIIDQDKSERNINVIFHVPIPIENNKANPAVPLRSAISEHIKPILQDGSLGVFASKLHNIDASELLKLQNGELIEIEKKVNFLAGRNKTQKLKKINDIFNNLSTKQLNKLRKTLEFWGHSQNVI